MSEKKIKILMVCLGNICRSPTAEVVFRQTVLERGLQNSFEIDSAGTGDWHIGLPPDTRATHAAAKRDMDLTPLRARLVTPADFDVYDYIYAMDKENFKNLMLMSPDGQEDKVRLFLTNSDGKPVRDYEEVPDPYYEGDDGFELVLDLIEIASGKLIDDLIQHHQLTQ